MLRSHEAQPLALAAWRRLEHGFDAAFAAALNPLRHLGALGFLAFWLLAASGIYLYAVLDTSAAGAYRSIVDLSQQQPWLGGLLRSLHRYAADAFVILMATHLLREWLHGHYRGMRRFSWLTGVPPIVLVFVSAIGGFWLHWDRLGQYSAIATAEWIDALPLLAAPLARNFLSVNAVSDRLFSLFVFVHLGAPLLLLFALWFHIQRLTRAGIWPPRPLGLGLLLTLLALALAAPVTSHAPADLATVPQALRLDWILLFIHPLAEAGSPQLAWTLALGALGLLFALPFLAQPVPAPAAVVNAANCNGCRRCFADCPFAAITMVPHPNQKETPGRPKFPGSPSGGRSPPGGLGGTQTLGKQMARVDADLCTGCGICVGACPVVDAVSQRGRAGHRHRYAAGTHRCPAHAAAARHRGAAGGTALGGFRLRLRRACRFTGRARRGHFQFDLHRPAAAVLRRIRAARRCGRCAGQRLPRRGLRVPPRPALDRGTPAGPARAASARRRAARTVRDGVGRQWRRNPPRARARAPARPCSRPAPGGRPPTEDQPCLISH